MQSRMNLSDGKAIHILQLGANRGKGGAIKAGIEFTRGRYILMVGLSLDWIRSNILNISK